MKTMLEFVESVKKGTMGVNILVCTEPKMNKRNNPFYGRVRKVSIRTNIRFGIDYESSVNGRLESENKVADFSAEKPNGKHWVNYPYLLGSDKDDNQKYLRVYPCENTKNHTYYIIDGERFATDEEVEIIKSFLPKSNNTAWQGGLDKKLNCQDYKVENVLAIKQGAKEWSRSYLWNMSMTQMMLARV